MDNADRAFDLEEAQRQAALSARVRPGASPSMWFCEDCLQAIPEARRLAQPSCTRCVDCQALIERGAR